MSIYIIYNQIIECIPTITIQKGAWALVCLYPARPKRIYCDRAYLKIKLNPEDYNSDFNIRDLYCHS